MNLRSLEKLLAPVSMILVAGALFLAPAQEAPQKKVKDQGEFDIFMAAQKETVPAKKIDLLKQWREKYPETDYKEERLVLMVTTYQQLGQGENMWSTASELVALNPKSVPGLFFLTSLTISLNNTAADRLDLGEKAARGLLGNLDEIFKKKPDNQTEEQFKRDRLNMETLARKTIGWIEMSRKNPAKAEEEFLELLKVNPNSGQVSYWLGSVMVAQKKPEKQLPALYHFARAAYYSGEDPLTEAGKKQLQAFVERNYVNYHGGKDGLQELIDLAAKNPVPDKYPEIESAAAKAAREYNEMLQKDPQKALWLNVRKELVGPGGPDYFSNTLKGSALPKLKGKVMSVNPAAKPKEVLISIASEGAAEIKLVVDAAYPNAATEGSELEFEGAVAKEFTADPFLLTCDIEKTQITGWPEAPKAAKKAPAKKAAKKK